jgi:hypothetical protein
MKEMKKMKKNPLVRFASICLLFVLSGCVSTSIEKRFPERWEKTYIGMSLDEFKQVWPEARHNGQGTDNTEIYSYTPLNMYTFNPKIEFFVFSEDKLIKYFEQ